jgi:hypothetical protein
MNRATLLLLPLLALLPLACRRASDEDAKALVTSYTERLAEAYRRSDEAIVDPLVTEEQGRKLLGLIGVKQDMGIVLDSRLLELKWEGVSREGDSVLVDTRERWAYRDVSRKTGAQVGSDSLDLYAIRYRVVREDGKLKVASVQFREEPVVGRKVAPNQLDARTAHGVVEDPTETASTAVPTAGAKQR